MQYIRMRERSLRYYMDPMCKILHRDEGPAVTYNNGCVEFWNLGVLHNSDGPAIVTKNGKKVYYLFGKRFNNYADWEQSKKIFNISESSNKV